MLRRNITAVNSVGRSFPGGSVVKNPPDNARDAGSVPRSGRSPGEGNGNSLQFFLPEKSHGQRSLEDYSPWSHKRVRHNLATKEQQGLPRWLSGK